MNRRVDRIWAIAGREFGDRLSNRWIWTVSVLFLLCSGAIVFFGAVPVGVAGVQKSGVVLASLMNLTVYLVPLLALMAGAGAIVDDARRGTLDLVLTHPVSRSEYFAGAFLGHSMALGVALLSSLLPLGFFLRTRAGVGASEFGRMMLLIMLLAAAFLALSFLLSLLARDRGRSMASSVLVWIVTVFVFDLLLVGALTLYPGEIPTQVFGGILLLNPVDVFRLLSFKLVSSTAAPLGLTTVSLPLPTPVLMGVMASWIVVPLVLGYRIFNRRLSADRLI